MNAILSFELPEDRGEFEIATRSMDWALVAWVLDQKLRGIVKYGEKYGGETINPNDADLIRGLLHDILDEHNLTLDMIE